MYYTVLYASSNVPPKRGKHGIYRALAQLNFLLYKTMKNYGCYFTIFL